MDKLGRRGLLKCMAWAGTGALWSFAAGVPGSVLLDQAVAAPRRGAGFSFVQVSDSHIGFTKPPNPDARETLGEAVAKIGALPERPAFILHTGDVSQLSRPAEWDDADQILAGAGVPVFHVPGEHDMLDEGNGAAFLERYGKDARGDGWFAFDHGGVHFVGLVNVKALKAGGMGRLGEAQLAWLRDDLAGRSASTPIVVFAHIPLWTMYADWGWGTDDGARALELLRRFGSVTVLNGHVHQVAQKVEGRITFHTARSTAFPQPAPGTAPAPGPLVVPAGQLRDTLGVRTAAFVRPGTPIALVDQTLAAAPSARAEPAPAVVKIANFTFGPQTVAVAAGGAVGWVNEDDIPHTVRATDGSFASKVLDTGERFSVTFAKPGEHAYFCSLHPMMTGKVTVRP